MSMIDLTNVDKLSPEQQAQFKALLDQFPHLESKMVTTRELNTPTKQENFITPPETNSEELDYSDLMAPPVTTRPPNRDGMPNMKVNPLSSPFSSLEKEEVAQMPTKEAIEQKEQQIKQQQVNEALAAGQSPELAQFSTVGKVHPVLQKLRATVGLRSVQDPVIVNLGGCNYGMRPLDRLAVANATTLALAMTDNKMIYETNLETAIIAFSIVSIDNVPLADIFSIPKEEIYPGEKVAKPISNLRREDMAAEAFYTELQSSPNELVDALSVYYQQEFPPLNLIGGGKAKYLCPIASCLQSRIADFDATCFCPVHGEKMVREDQIPNPS